MKYENYMKSGRTIVRMNVSMYNKNIDGFCEENEPAKMYTEETNRKYQ